MTSTRFSFPLRPCLAAGLAVLLVACGGDRGSPADGGRVDGSPGPDAGPPIIPPASSPLTSGRSHTCAIGTGGAVYCWGAGADYGELGHGSYEVSATPVRVELDGPVRGVWSSSSHTCALTEDGTGYCWGNNRQSILGQRIAESQSAVPVEISGGHRFAQIATGSSHTCGVRLDGALFCWGGNFAGQLGVGDETYRQEPTRAGEDSDWKAVAAADQITCALKLDSTLWCWGQFDTMGFSPQQYGTDADWTAIAASVGRVCGIRAPGRLVCFDKDNTRFDDTFEPTLARDDVRDVAVGEDHVCLIAGEGELLCFGDNAYEQLGTGDRGARSEGSPQRIGTDSDWEAVSAGRQFTCARRTNGSVHCFGRNTYGELGNGQMGLTVEPRQVGTDTDWIDIAVGYQFTCGLRSGGTAYCFGRNDGGQLAIIEALPPPFEHTPVAIDGGETFVAIQATSSRVFGLYEDGAGGAVNPIEWGQNEDGSTVGRPRSPSDGHETGGWAQLSMGPRHACGIKPEGTLECFGNANMGALGTDFPGLQPVQVGPDMDWTAVSVASASSCGIRAGGDLYCWGDSEHFQIGSADMDTPTPQPIEPGMTWTGIASGDRHHCGTLADGRTFCWGDGSQGVLGIGPREMIGAPPTEVVGGHTFTQLGLGSEVSCGITDAGELYCWGALDFGPTLDELITNAEAPVRIGDRTDWARVDAGRDHVCALRTDGTLHCFGDDVYGQLGAGLAYQADLSDVPVP